ncbi:MAG: AAA family ATPase, partial [Gemmatimonadaceae bacterium]|nr:AAA family ATPase [Gemmatimonadaceae bacterium]
MLLASPDGATMGPGKPIAMLAYLLLEGETSRDKLIELLWGDQTDKNARNAFRQTLYRLRAALGEGNLEANSETVAIPSGNQPQSDVSQFEALLQAGRSEDALSVYRGPFLDGLGLDEGNFGQWVSMRRHNFEAKFHGALRRGIAARLERGDPQGAIDLALQLATSAPLEADAALLTFNTLVNAGRLDEGRAHLEMFTTRYRQEFQEEPPVEVRETIGRLRKHARVESNTPGAENRQAVGVIGREAELGKLAVAFNQVRKGSGAGFLIEGPAGVGKSAMVGEFMRRAATSGPILLLTGQEHTAGSRIPFASIASALRGTLNAPGLSGASRHLLADASRLLPELRDQFDLPETEQTDREASRVRLFEGLAALLDAVAYEQPVCVVLEDFHNAARESRDLVQYLAGRLTGVSVMFVVCYRTDKVAQSKTPGDISDDNSWIPPSFTRLPLGPLTMDAVKSLISGTIDSDILSEADIAQLAELSGGIPYRALELARQAGGGMNPGAVPTTLPDALWARLQGFSPAQQRLFLACALVERPIHIRIAAAAAHISDSAALDGVLALEAAGLLTQTVDGVRPTHDFAATLALKGTGPAGLALL